MVILLPLGQKRAESAWPTSRNLNSLEKFLKILDGFDVRVLLSGSMAYGPFYAVHEGSDVDMLITADHLDQLRLAIKNLISAKIYPPEAFSRFEAFSRLYSEGRAQMFSVRATLDGTEIGTDFYPWDVVENICALAPLGAHIQISSGTQVQVRAVKEFRKKLPAKEEKYLDNIYEGGQVLADLHYSLVNPNGPEEGYLYDAPVDGVSVGTEPTDYFLGLLAFYFLVSPVILMDDGKLAALIQKFKNSVALIGDGRSVQTITRQERMDPITLQHVKESLTQPRQ